MSEAIPEHYVRSFEKVWNKEIQQELSKLGDKTMVKNFEGKELAMTDLSQVEFRERDGRLGDTDPDEVTGTKRKVIKQEFKCPIIFDRSDKEFLGGLSTPDGEVVSSMKSAWNRLVDTKLIAAALGDAYGGAEPYITPLALPSSQKVDVQLGSSDGETNIGLTPDKILRAKKFYQDNDIPINENETYLWFGPQEEEELWAYVKASTNDAWAGMIAAYLEGKVPKLFGFNVINTNRLPVNSSDIASCGTFSRAKGLVTAPEKFEIKMDVLPEKDHALQIVAYANYGFTRRYDKGVVEIPCDRSPS